MYDTLSVMYNMAMEYYTNSNSSKRNSNEEEENFRNILEEGVCIHFKAVCDCSSVDVSGAAATPTLDTSVGESKTTTNNMERIVQCQLLKLETLHKASTYYERMQSCKFIYLLFNFFDIDIVLSWVSMMIFVGMILS